jgi:UDP-galactopyranose mutase
VSYDVLVVGAGLAGSTIAERCAAEFGANVLLVDRRPHLAGNCHDPVGADGLRYHQYGPHIFHTNSEQVVDYLSAFTEWRSYVHRVLANVDGRLVPIPINRTTINALYDLDLDEAGVASFLERVALPRAEIRTSEDVILSRVGRELYERFFRGYTRKQWGLDLSQLSAGVAARIPVRFDTDDRYFTDKHQAMPAEGYTRLFENLVAHEHIEVRLGVDFRSLRDSLRPDHVVYSGPVDEYYDYCYGKLPYRSLRFEHEHLPGTRQYQAVGTVNYPNDHDYTRITEFKHLTGEQHPGTSIVREYPQSEGDPYYPIPRPENEALFRRYRERANAEGSTTFVGRLAEYRYYNMDQVVGAALTASERIVAKLAAGR